jgi:deazaflavin-dependent oxidoreductase (nitroreductase family)
MTIQPYLRPNWVINRIVHPVMVILGVKVSVAVRGRRTGAWHTVPVNVLEVDGQHYLIAPRGNTQWARNLRVAGTGELRRRGWRRSFRAVELPDEAKPALIEAYRKNWGLEANRFFAELPSPSDHPIFRLEFK